MIFLNPLDQEKFIELNIKKSRCNCFIPEKNDICGCGRKKSEHHQEVVEKYQNQLVDISDKMKWDPEEHTTEDGDTDAYGEIRFNNQESKSKFVRVDHKTNMDTLIDILFNYWKLDPPKLLISVTGGALNFKLKPRLRDVFRKGLIKAALSTSAWISSGGSHAGVMKIVGEAIKVAPLKPDEKIVTLGIANWCTVTNNHLLIKKKTKYENEVFDYTNLTTNTKQKQTPLDPNHSHFILVDNAQLNVFGGEINLRGKLESAISNYKSEKSSNLLDSGDIIPIVVVVLEGGPNTISTVLASVKNGSPCVFVEGSGKCADFFAFALSKLAIRDDPLTLKHLDEGFKSEILKKIENQWPGKPSKAILQNFEETLKFPHLLSVFRMDSNDRMDSDDADIDIAILRALLKAKKSNYKAQLKLALTWNRIDIARNFIFTDEKTWWDGSLNDLMFYAIINDKVDFVQIFLDNGCSMKQFLSIRRLIKLYNKIPDTSLLFILIMKLKRQKHRLNGVIELEDIGQIIQSLLGSNYEHRFVKQPIFMIDQNETKKILEETDDCGNPSDPHLKDRYAQICEYPEHEMFMYCILLNRTEMSKIFWKTGQNEICSSLVATKIYKSYAKLFEDESEELNAKAIEFEKLSSEVLNSCYEQNYDEAQMLLLREIPEFGDSTPLEVAVLAEDKIFVSSPCCQSLLMKIWFGQISKDTPGINLFFSTLIPLLAPKLINWESDKNKLKLEVLKLDSSLSPTYPKKLISFFNAPYVKFMYNQLMFLLFLCLFSYVLMCEFYPIEQTDSNGTKFGQEVKWPEKLLIMCVFAFACDAIYMLYVSKNFKLFGSSNKSLWVKSQFVSIILFLIGIVLRYKSGMSFYLAARIILSLDLILWYFRSLYFIYSIRSLGPKLVMINQMVYELAYFISIILVFMVAYGVANQSLLYHNQTFDLELLKNIFFPTFFVIGGDYYEKDTIMNAHKCINSNESFDVLIDKYTRDDCPETTGAKVSLGLFVGYLVMVQILLLNLLIAIFSNTYSEIELEADKIWKFQRYWLVYDYVRRPCLVSPLTIFQYIYMVIQFLKNCLIRFYRKDITIKPNENNKLRDWESFVADEHIAKEQIKVKETQEYRIQQNSIKLDLVNSKLDEQLEYRDELNSRIVDLEKKIDILIQHLTVKNNTEEPKEKTKRTNSSDQVIEENMETDKIFYPNSRVAKFSVENNKKYWSIKWSEYKPPSYTSQNVLLDKNADNDLMKIPINQRPFLNFNSFDYVNEVDRTSCLGDYSLVNGLPKNPKGRTGIEGRGEFLFWGPNHAIEVILTRFKRDANNEFCYLNNRKILEFICIENSLNPDDWSFPCVFDLNRKSDQLSETFEKKLIEEIFDLENAKNFIGELKFLLKNPIKLTKYFKDSNLNTDNAWLELLAINFHDHHNILKKLSIKESGNKKILWKEFYDQFIFVNSTKFYHLKKIKQTLEE